MNHAEKYVDGQIHTNGMENFWSLLKRGLKGTYASVITPKPARHDHLKTGQASAQNNLFVPHLGLFQQECF